MECGERKVGTAEAMRFPVAMERSDSDTYRVALTSSREETSMSVPIQILVFSNKQRMNARDRARHSRGVQRHLGRHDMGTRMSTGNTASSAFPCS